MAGAGSRLLGAAEVWGLPFRLSPGTLVPRPDTETLVAAALALVPDRAAPVRILDLGTGSGCILVALLHELPAATGLGIDRHLSAAAAARNNARANGVADRALFALSDWDEAVEGRFDLVVSNPPYIPRADIAGLDPEVAHHDPGAALDGGPDGLDSLKVVLRAAARLLAPGGHALAEFGHDQADAVSALAREAGLNPVEILRDMAGHRRAVVMRCGEPGLARGVQPSHIGRA
jgi:release factor glutamine methyltransferase